MLVHGSIDVLHKRFDDFIHVDLPYNRQSFLVALFGCFFGLAVHGFVVIDSQPGRQVPVELFQGEQVPDADFGLQLSLNRLDEPFDQTARWRISLGPMQQFDVESIAT